MTKNQIKEFVKAHKKEIAIATTTVVGIAVLGATGTIVKKKFGKKVAAKAIETAVEEVKWIDVDTSGITVATITDACGNGSWIDMIVNDVTVDELATLAEQLKTIKGVTGETEISACVSLIENEL